MYRDFYRLSDEPFRVTPDPDFLFLADQYKEALAAIVYGIAKRKGFICITGEVGVGKTTILRSYLNSVEDQGLTFVYVFNPRVSFAVLMRTILRDLGQTTDGDVAELVERLHEHLIACYRANKTVVLFVDEAQNMPVETIENLRMLSNLETSTDKLIQIVLVGQPELDELLSRPQLRPLKSRIVVRAKLGPLSKTDSVAYIRHRLGRVALEERPIFTDAAMQLIVREALGVPRIINILCDAALITGFGYRIRPIPTKVVHEVVRDTFGNERRSPARRWAIAASVAAIALAGAGAWSLTQAERRSSSDPIADLIVATEKMAAATDKAASPPGAAPTEAATPPPAPVPAPGYGPAEEGPDPGADLVRVVSPLPKPPTPAAPPGQPKPEQADTHDTPAPAKPAAAAATTPPAPDHPPASDHPAAPSDGAAQTPRAMSSVPPPKPPAPPLPPAPAPKQASAAGSANSRSVVVKAGDTLSKLSLDVYGTANTDVLGQLQHANPNITDIDRLYVGQVVAFPSLAANPGAPQEAAVRKDQ